MLSNWFVAAGQGQSTAIDIEPVNITDEEKEQLKFSYGDSSSSSLRSDISDRPFLDTVLSALDCSENDYLALLGLCLIYALANNKGKLGVNKFRINVLCSAVFVV